MLIVAHRVLIGAAIAFGGFYAVWEAVQYRRAGGVSHLLAAAVAAVVTLALAYYLKNLRRFLDWRG